MMTFEKSFIKVVEGGKHSLACLKLPTPCFSKNFAPSLLKNKFIYFILFTTI